MKCTLTGNFMEEKVINKKDGTTMVKAIIYSDGDTVEVSDLPCAGLKKFQELTIPVLVKSTQYGLYVKAITADAVS